MSESRRRAPEAGWSDDRAQESSSRGPRTVSVVGAPQSRARHQVPSSTAVPRPVPARRTAGPRRRHAPRASHPEPSSTASRASPCPRPSHGQCLDTGTRRGRRRACRRATSIPTASRSLTPVNGPARRPTRHRGDVPGPGAPPHRHHEAPYRPVSPSHPRTGASATSPRAGGSLRAATARAVAPNASKSWRRPPSRAAASRPWLGETHDAAPHAQRARDDHQPSRLASVRSHA
jgi:hypothetical protein